MTTVAQLDLQHPGAIRLEDRIIEFHRGNSSMAMSVNAGPRLDRLPVSSFPYRIFWRVGAGMFFDGYDLYFAGSVLA